MFENWQKACLSTEKFCSVLEKIQITELIHMLDLPLIQIQQTYANKSTYLETSRYMMLSLTDINARLVSISNRSAHILMSVDKIYIYLGTLATHTVPPLLLPPSTLSVVIQNIKRGMA